MRAGPTVYVLVRTPMPHCMPSTGNETPDINLLTTLSYTKIRPSGRIIDCPDLLGSSCNLAIVWLMTY